MDSSDAAIAQLDCQGFVIWPGRLSGKRSAALLEAG
jgi:hypothetical protein